MLKEKAWRNEKYKSWVRTLPCSHCGTDQDIVAHHIIGCGYGLGGAGTKADDCFIVALCTRCHYLVHNGGTEIIKQSESLVETLQTAMRRGVITEFELNDDCSMFVQVQNAFRSEEVEFLKRGKL